MSLQSTDSATSYAFTNACEDLPGILKHLPEPLFRRDTSRTETENSHLGIGIGLTVSREAATAMGGSLIFRNRPVTARSAPATSRHGPAVKIWTLCNPSIMNIWWRKHTNSMPNLLYKIRISDRPFSR